MIPRLRPETNLKNIFKAAFLGNGKEKLREQLIKYFNCEDVILCDSARAGLYWLLRACKRENVYMPGYTCWVVDEAARAAKKNITYLDIDINTYNVTFKTIKEKVKPGSILILTHQFGIPSDIVHIIDFAGNNDIVVIEDNAAAFGSRYKTRLTGTFGAAAIVSFEGTKVITGNGGGAIIINDSTHKEFDFSFIKIELNKENTIYGFKHLLKLIINEILLQPKIYKLTHIVFSYLKGFTTAETDFGSTDEKNYRKNISKFQASLAYLSLLEEEKTIAGRNAIAELYLKELKDNENIAVPEIASDDYVSYMRFPIRILKDDKYEFYKLCIVMGFDLALTFSYICGTKDLQLPNSEIAAEQILNLPLYSRLKAKEINKITGFLRNYVS